MVQTKNIKGKLEKKKSDKRYQLIVLVDTNTRTLCSKLTCFLVGVFTHVLFPFKKNQLE